MHYKKCSKKFRLIGSEVRWKPKYSPRNEHDSCNSSMRRLGQKDHCEFRASLNYITRPCLKKQKKERERKVGEDRERERRRKRKNTNKTGKYVDNTTFSLDFFEDAQTV